MAGKNDWIANGKWLITEEERKKIIGKRAILRETGLILFISMSFRCVKIIFQIL